MKVIEWSSEKSKLLKKIRGISFEDVINAFEEGRILDIVKHPNSEKYPNQEMYIIEINEYIYQIPFVKSDKKEFLKTIIPNRKATKKYLTKNK